MFRAMPSRQPDPFAYANSFDAFGQQLPLPSQTTPFDPQARRERDFAITVQTSPDPEQVGKVSQVARKAGVAPGLIEDQVDLALRGINIRDMTAVMRQFPVIGKFFENNPRAAVMAQDDGRNLGALSRLWEDTAGFRKMGAAVGSTLGKVPASGKAMGFTTGAVGGRLNEGLAEAMVDVDVFFKKLATPGRYTNADIDEMRRKSREYWAGPTRYYQAEAARVRPQYSGIVEEGLLGGIEQLGPSVMAAAATVATRNPRAGYFIMGATSGLPAYSDARKAGLTPAESLVYSVEQGGTEILTEKIPASRLLSDLVNKSPVGKVLLNQLVTEIPGEQVATAVQDLSEWVHINPDKTVGEYLAERPDAAIKTLLGTVSGTTVQTGAAVGVNAVVERATKAQQAKAEGAALERHGKIVEDSKLRTRDPETFREAMKAVLEDNGTEHVYLPGEAAVEYFQSDAYDPDNDPMAEYYHEAFDAAASGGDIVLPADFVMATLPGTPAWEALRPDLRLSGGGLSMREADEVEASLDDMMAEIDDRLQSMDEAVRGMNDARALLVEKITAKLNNAGFTPYMARAQAEYIAQRSATRAARLGKTLTGDEFDAVEVNQVLPPELAKAKAADGIDLVINALRKGKDAEVYDGPSLIEWIAKRGGINDTGGDLKSMGLDKWHRGKVGRKKLLRKFDPAQGAFGGVSGAGDYGVDTTLRAAIEAGYFPELAGVEGEMGPSSLDTQALLDAMAEEMAGRPRYAGEARVDPMRAAAEELRGLLADRGLDPEGMSDAELRQVIAQLDAASAGGFEQLPDVIDIDGVARPTRNSEGQPIAGSEEGVRAFYRWFGESKVVDEEGRPLVVYHGTQRAGFEVFNTSNYAFFTNRESIAASYSGTLDGMANEDFGAQDEFDISANYAAYLRIENALDVDFEGRQWGNGPQGMKTDDWASRARSDGKDGLIARNVDDSGYTAPGFVWDEEAKTYDGVGDIYAAFRPEQIKSINNRGTFDPADARILYQGGVDSYTRRDPAQTGEQTGVRLENNLASVAVFARDNRFATGRDLKLALQERALLAQQETGIDLSTLDDDTAARLADFVVEDALEAVQDNQNAIGWYDRAVTAAKAEMAKIFPEISTDPKSEFAFIWALAVTSNGLKVDKNFELAAKAYEAWKEGGSFPSNIGIGQAAKGINDGLALYQVLIDKLGSWEAARDFMVNEQLVRDIEKIAGIPISGEGKAEKVRGAAILGPKIGNGFFSNLYGHFDSLTMDRWLMRTVGRWRGTLIATNPRMEAQKRDEIKDLIGGLSDKARKHLEGFFNGTGIRLTKRMTLAQVDALANEVAKRSMAVDWRENINKVEGGEDLRKLGNALAKYLDGQVEQPGGTKERSFIRSVFKQGLEILRKKDGLENLTMADLQALLWYPEKLLYESAKKPVGQEVRSYDDDEAPDYANAARKLVRDRLGSTGQGGNRSRPGGPGLADQQGAEAGQNQGLTRSYFQPAYHGSPHIFDKFSLSAIGTGEGAQAYGWGLYFAGKREIAQFYKETLGRKFRDDAELDGKTYKEINAELAADENAEGDDPRFDALLGLDLVGQNGSVDAAIAVAEKSEIASIREAAEWIREHYDRITIREKGRLYQVEIPEDDEYLLWDKPLSEQPEKVRAAIDKLKGGDKPAEELSNDELFAALGGFEQTLGDKEKTGQGFYKELSADLAAKAGRKDADEGNGWTVVNPTVHYMDQAASKLLHDLGIAGIKYLDGSSRSNGEGSYNYVVFDENRVSIQAYEQTYGDGPRGRIVFDTRRTVIDLFQARNNSTLIHELSHMWLEELRIDAELPDAPEQLKNDWQIVQDWFAANNVPVTDGIIPVEAHELFARAGERYAMEGKAPSPALTRLFETFRGWMVSIYKTVTALRAPITPEIRGVFDRLVATDEELNAMAERQALEPLFKDAASIGMSEQEFAAYSSEVDNARTGAASGLLTKTMASVKARVTKEWNDERRKLSEENADALDQTPLYRALRALKSSPVNAQWIRDEMGADALDLLPRRVPPVYSDKGAHPDAIAEMAGYGSGREMIDALIGAEIQHRQAKEGGDQRTMRERTIAQNVDEEMRRRHGDPFSDGSIEREALEAVHNDKQGEVFAAEARALARKTGQRVTPYKVAREWARRRVREGTYAAEASPAAIQRHARNAAKAGTAAEKAMIAGKFDEALLAKQQQMLASAQLSEAKQANDEVEAARKRMDKIARRATSKSVDQDYLDQAHALLEAVDLRERSQKLLNRAGSWEEWSNARAAEGFDIVVPPSFEALIGKTNWSRLPVEQLLGLDAAVAQVMHLGRLKQTLLDNQERRDFEELVQEARAGAGNIDGPPPQDLMEPGWFDAVKAKVAATDAALLKMETIFDWLDGGNPNGVFNRIAFRPIADAQGREQDMLVDYYGRIKSLFEAVPGEITQRWGDTVTLPFTNRETGRPERVRRQQLLAIALNTGNEGNLQRLTDGYGWNADALMEVLNAELTADEWVMVQGVWDVIETLWPEIEGMEKRVNGLAPEKVEAREIVTPFGTFRGGYYPAIYDSTRNYRAEENRGKESDLFEGGYTRATTRSSATKNRLDKVTAPILLDLGVINRHLGEVIHDVTHREAVMQANKFLTNERIMRVVDEALGPEIRKQFRPWVKFVANSWAIERAGNEGFGKWLGKLRANVTAVGMGLRATTMITQIAGYSNSIEVVGEKWVAEAIARTTAHPVDSFRFVLDKSAEVRGRMDTLDRDIRTELARLSAANPASKAARAVLDGRKFFFHGIGYMDRVVVVPTWIAAYNKAQSEGMAEQDAIYAADKAVRVSQGSGAPKDMAAITRGTGKWGEALKLMTMFYSYFSAMYQRERTLGRDVAGNDQRRPRNVPRLAARAFWLLAVPPLLTEVLKAGLGGGDAPDDEEWWAQWVIRKMLANSIGPIPMARDVFEPAWNAARGGQAFTPAFSPVNRALSSFVDAARDVGKIARGDETTKATKHILETTGYATGLVPGQVASAAQFMVDVGAGDADPEGFADWVQGLSTGKIKDD